MEKNKQIITFDQLISIFMIENLSLLINRNRDKSVEEIIGINNKFNEIKDLMIKNEEKKLFYDVMDYNKKNIFKSDLKEEKKNKNSLILGILFWCIWFICFLVLGINNFKEINDNNISFYYGLISLLSIYVISYLIVNFEKKIINRLVLKKINILNKEEKQKLLVLFFLEKEKLLGGEKLIENIIENKCLFERIKQIKKDVVYENEAYLNIKIIGFMDI